jgi:hypothetical protein
MMHLSEEVPFYLYYDSWHEEGDAVVIRKKKRLGEAVILNPSAAALWKIVERGEWTVRKFKEAVSKNLAVDKQEGEQLVNEFLNKMIQEEVISTTRVSLFEE